MALAICQERLRLRLRVRDSRPGTGRSACLVLPEVFTAAMQVVLDSFSSIPAAAVLDAACDSWNRITPERLRSLTTDPWLPQVSS